MLYTLIIAALIGTISAGKCGINELRNRRGQYRCQYHSDCNGDRTCSKLTLNGFMCTGNSNCTKSGCFDESKNRHEGRCRNNNDCAGSRFCNDQNWCNGNSGCKSLYYEQIDQEIQEQAELDEVEEELEELRFASWCVYEKCKFADRSEKQDCIKKAESICINLRIEENFLF